jgi:hypothetical protein
MTTQPKAALFGNTGPAGETIDGVYGAARIEHLRRLTELYPAQITSRNIEEHLGELHDLEVIFSTWGMFQLSPKQLDQLPHLRAVFYAAGSVKYFAVPLLAAEYSGAFRGRGNYGATVSILGAGQIGRHVIELLRPFQLRVLVFDPFLTHKGAESLGVKKVETLEEAFAQGDIVSNHLADVPTTSGLLHGVLFASMRENATFINTGRGRTVNHAEMIEVLRARPDLTALLDVTEPEPLPMEHLLRALPNVYISGHIAGSIGDEVGRMADLVLEEFKRWQNGDPLLHAVSLLTLERAA